MSIHYNLYRENVVEDVVSWLFTGSVAHEEKLKELVKNFHRLARLGVHLMSISDSGVTF